MINKSVAFRLSQKEIDALNNIAVSLNYFYGGKPCFTKVLRDIAEGNLIISKNISKKT